ncbi:type II toxin-antitoxin system RelE/ParE family toxin [Delftia lacustris]|uniref:type II toxin-antitoxin system RelE/ParE family toxin n=1 Tax=Delftia lacustris TaxID=558537 RepID=UPI00193C1D1E|nr:type II toxin-antitoxin system RelE/ParE family toxin [Delftia lacustris]QRI92974.1 type II toxin-antitoxin system RelE/ParE family toxin [Delftia lacustris]
MIRSFRHKGLQALHESGKTAGVRHEHAARLRRLLVSLEAAQKPTDMDRPGNRLHMHKGGVYSGYWAVNVSGAWRLVFRFAGSDVELVDYLNYH